MKYIEVHITTQYGNFIFKHNKVFGDIERFVDKMKRSILQGSVGCPSDWTVGNHGQVNAPKLVESTAKPEIKSIIQVLWRKDGI